MSSYELRLPLGLPSSPLDEYFFALVALSFEYSSKESFDYFSIPVLLHFFMPLHDHNSLTRTPNYTFLDSTESF